MAGLVSINGHITPIEEGLVPAQDRGFLFGDAIFEILASRNGRIMDFAAHIARFRRAAKQCRMPIPWSDAELQFEMEHLLSLTGFQQSSLRLLVSRGTSAGMKQEPDLKTNRYVFCTAAPLPTESQLEAGLLLKTKKNPQNPRGELIKSPNYLPNIVAQAEAKEEGFEEILWISSEGEITEAGTANIFLISREGDLVEIATPPPAVGILAGVTRARVIELLNRSQIPVTERSISIEELPRFDEGFVTSSLRGPFPVSRIDKHRLHSTRPQAVFQHILRLYRSWESHEGDGSQGAESPLN
jgi:branched-subunit amino acid aminotransferase/4-amino-4-deoxychorismate lyase